MRQDFKDDVERIKSAIAALNQAKEAVQKVLVFTMCRDVSVRDIDHSIVLWEHLLKNLEQE